MKVKKCPARKHCFDYKDNNCDNCDFGNEFTKLNKRIDRLKKQNETLTIQRNAWALTAKALGEKWISVEERLPEEKVMVLGHIHTKYKDGGERDSILTMELRNGKDWIPFNCSPIKGCSVVTHWMPLPEPPKMKGGAE